MFSSKVSLIPLLLLAVGGCGEDSSGSETQGPPLSNGGSPTTSNTTAMGNAMGNPINPGDPTTPAATPSVGNSATPPAATTPGATTTPPVDTTDAIDMAATDPTGNTSPTGTDSSGNGEPSDGEPSDTVEPDMGTQTDDAPGTDDPEGSGGNSSVDDTSTGGNGAGEDLGTGAVGNDDMMPASSDGCPADASFCSGFESDELPTGAVFKLNGDPATPWTALFEVDTAQAFSGASSLRVRKNSEPDANTMYKMLAVPSGGTNFWVRMYMRSDIELGQDGHNAYAAASATDDPNDNTRVEFADDVGLSFNASDDVRWPEGYGRLSDGGTSPYTLPADMWHCIELHFDGAGRAQSMFIEGEEVLVAADYPSSAMDFAVFKFGYQGFHNEADRGVWYDDVAVGPTRIGCM